MAPLLSLSEVTKRYPDGRHKTAVLDRVSLEIDAGDYLGIFDARSSGKSTLLRIIAGVELPDEGSVCWDGQDVTRMSSSKRSEVLGMNGIALMSSRARVQLNRSVVDYVAVGLIGDRISLRRARRLARRALEDVGVAGCADMQTDHLSLDQHLRVILAGALVHEPRLLLVDEPAVLPNPQQSEALFRLLRSLGEREDLAVVIASQGLAALHGARRQATLSNGGLRLMNSETVVSLTDRRAGNGHGAAAS